MPEAHPAFLCRMAWKVLRGDYSFWINYTVFRPFFKDEKCKQKHTEFRNELCVFLFTLSIGRFRWILKTSLWEFAKMQVLLWSWWWDSNSWPHPYQGCALPPVPHQRSILSDSSVMIPHSEAFCKPFFEKNRHLWLCTIQHCCFGFQVLIYHIDARLSEKDFGQW